MRRDAQERRDGWRWGRAQNVRWSETDAFRGRVNSVHKVALAANRVRVEEDTDRARDDGGARRRGVEQQGDFHRAEVLGRWASRGRGASG